MYAKLSVIVTSAVLVKGGPLMVELKGEGSREVCKLKLMSSILTTVSETVISVSAVIVPVSRIFAVPADFPTPLTDCPTFTISNTSVLLDSILFRIRGVMVADCISIPLVNFMFTSMSTSS